MRQFSNWNRLSKALELKMNFRTEIGELFDVHSANSYTESIHHPIKYPITDLRKHMYENKITRIEAGTASNV